MNKIIIEKDSLKASEPLRILHIIGGLGLGGTEKMLLNVARRLNPNRFKSIVCTFDGGPLARELRASNIEMVYLKKRYPFDLFLLLRLVYLIKKKKINIIHCRLLRATIYGLLAAKITRTPVVVSLHGRHYEYKRGKFTYRMASRYSNTIFAVSKNIASDFITNTGMDSRKIDIVYNGVDLDFYTLGLNQNPGLTPELGLKQTDVIVGAVGNLHHPVKGYPYLLESFAIVNKKFKHVKLIIIGDGKLKPELEQQARNLNIIESVRFLGQHKDVRPFLEIMDIFVLPSLSEGLSNALLEAMAFTKPVVATNVGGNSEVVEQGTSGILVEPKDHDQMAEAIISLIADKSKRLALGSAARRRVKNAFSFDEMVSKYQMLYENSC